MTRQFIAALLVLLAGSRVYSQLPAQSIVHFPVNGSELDEAAQADLAYNAALSRRSPQK